MDADGFMFPFRPGAEKPRRRWMRRTPSEKERTFCFGLFTMTVGLWDKDDWLELPNRCRVHVDFGDIVVTFAFSCWPGDWPP